jgi:hypothetical protein
MVLVEGSAIVVRKSSIIENYQGGMPQFLFDIPDGKALSQDDYLMSVSFNNYHLAKKHYFYIAKQGLKITDFMPEITFADAVLWDQNFGPSLNTYWVRFLSEKIDSKNTVRIAQFDFEENDYYDTEKMRMAKIGVPMDWKYEKSVTKLLPFERLNFYKSHLNH